MRLHEIRNNEHPNARDYYDLDRMSASKKSLVRKAAGISMRPEEGYRYGLVLDMIEQLMRTSPDDQRIADHIEALPWAARSYLQRLVIKRLPDGSTNPRYKPNKED